jgi:hypothetical protein
MVFGVPREGVSSGEANSTSFFSLVILLALLFMLGFYLPSPLHQLIEQAAKIVKP